MNRERIIKAIVDNLTTKDTPPTTHYKLARVLAYIASDMGLLSLAIELGIDPGTVLQDETKEVRS